MLRIKEDINMDELFRGWNKTDVKYTLDDNMGAFIEVYICSREVIQQGYNGLISDWYYQGILEIK